MLLFAIIITLSHYFVTSCHSCCTSYSSIFCYLWTFHFYTLIEQSKQSNSHLILMLIFLKTTNVLLRNICKASCPQEEKKPLEDNPSAAPVSNYLLQIKSSQAILECDKASPPLWSKLIASPPPSFLKLMINLGAFVTKVPVWQH